MAINKRRKTGKPGFNDQRELSVQLVDNPLAAHDLDLNSRVRTTKAEAVVNVRETPMSTCLPGAR